ncbi:hypothetical protein Pfo_000217 [Paulownia fortunei]|nr:hypothetical protein Pfo_000217 [Paulownia fortunei]
MFLFKWKVSTISCQKFLRVKKVIAIKTLIFSFKFSRKLAKVFHSYIEKSYNSLPKKKKKKKLPKKIIEQKEVVCYERNRVTCNSKMEGNLTRSCILQLKKK